MLDTHDIAEFMTRITRFLAKVGGFVKRKPRPYTDRGVIVTLTG
jgi:hypothetical protein